LPSASPVRTLLLGAAFGGHSLNVAEAEDLIKKGDQLLDQAATLAA